MLCSRVQKLLSAYCDSELGGVDMLRVRSHLDACAACREEMDSVRQIKQLLGSVPRADPCRPFESGLLDSPIPHPSWHRRAVRALKLDELTFAAGAAWDGLAEAVSRVAHTPANLALAGTALIVVLSMAVLAGAQPSDAVRAHVPEVVAPEPSAPPVDPSATLSRSDDPFVRFHPSYATPVMAQPFRPVSAGFSGSGWRSR